MALGELLPRHEIAVVLKHRKQNLVAWFQEPSESPRQQVDRGCRAVGENNFLVRFASDEAGNSRAGLIIGLGSETRPFMRSLVHVGADLHLEATHRGEHGLGHLGCSRIVEIMKLRVSEARNITLERMGIEGRFGQFSAPVTYLVVTYRDHSRISGSTSLS